MTGLHPTVGIVVGLAGPTVPPLVEGLLAHYGPLVRPHTLRAVLSRGIMGTPVGSPFCAFIGWISKENSQAFMFLEFDEDEFLRAANEHGIAPYDLIAPWVAAAQNSTDAVLVGVGFDLSPPVSLDRHSLTEAGFSHAWLRDPTAQGWTMLELRPFVGHY